MTSANVSNYFGIFLLVEGKKNELTVNDSPLSKWKRSVYQLVNVHV